MDNQPRGHSHEAQASDLDSHSSHADDVADLLELLADSRELAENARSHARTAEARADGAVAEAATLRREIDGMMATLVELDRKLDTATTQLKAAGSRIAALEAALVEASEHREPADSLSNELNMVRRSEQRLQLEVEAIRHSLSWRITAPLRTVRSASTGHRVAD
jgi:chromosome segregation ATPase